MTSISQKVRKALPAALAATMLGSAVLAAAPAQAAGTTPSTTTNVPADVRKLAEDVREQKKTAITQGKLDKVGGRSVGAKSHFLEGSWNGDSKADLLATKPNGDAFVYFSKGTSFEKAKFWDNVPDVNVLKQVGDLDDDGYIDLLYRTTDGYIFTDALHPDNAEWFSSGWGGFKNLNVPGDVTGDGKADLVANDTAGNFYMWRGNGNGTFGARNLIGSGWGKYTTIGRGDYSGDKKPDLLARDGVGNLWMYKGTGRSELPFKSRVLVGSGWNFTAYVSTGDMTGDSISDFLVRDSKGTLYVYPGRGSETVPFKTSQRVTIGGGWNAFSHFG
ncbi:FG-GAP repeat domain-containing protein [Streptomyces sp. NPDC003860]